MIEYPQICRHGVNETADVHCTQCSTDVETRVWAMLNDPDGNTAEAEAECLSLMGEMNRRGLGARYDQLFENAGDGGPIPPTK